MWTNFTGGFDMLQVNIHEAKTNLSKLIQKVVDGEEVIIARGNKPIAKLVELDELKPKRKPVNELTTKNRVFCISNL